MNQLGITIENQIDNSFYTLSKDLYSFITITVRDFGISTQILQRKINKICPLLSRLSNNKAFLDIQKQEI